MDTPKHSIDNDKFDSLFVEDRSIKQWIKDNQIGIYTTVIFHLLVFLALSFNEIHTLAIQSKSIELLYQNDEPEHKITPEEEKKQIEEELNKILREMPNSDIRLPNLAMNVAAHGSESGRGQGTSASFFSSRNSASIRAEKEKEKTREDRKNTGIDDITSDESRETEDGQAYKGPSIVSYYLEGRIAIHLPVPSYKCFKGGDVTALIEVNAQGYVIGVEIDKKNSSNDECLHRAAINAAERARFSSLQKSGTQRGNIVYRFVSQ